jgi:L,D-transpeptidase catalytic domain
MFYVCNVKLNEKNKNSMINKFFTILLTFSLTSAGVVKNSENVVVRKTTKARRIANANFLPFESQVSTTCKFLSENNSSLPQTESLTSALKGFYELKYKGVFNKEVITIIDFSLSSNSKRLWVIDLSNNKVLFNTYVAHGMNTGNEFANSFSNKVESHKSSLGFYATGEVYVGKHGTSLRLDGLEKGVNDTARARDVVIHGANYVSESFIRSNKYLGRSHGCPALPQALTKDIINVIKGKSCLYIYHPSRSNSKTNSKLVA